MTKDKHIKVLSIVIGIIILICVIVMFFPVKYSVEYRLYGDNKEEYALSKIEYISEDGNASYETDESGMSVEIPYTSDIKYEQMNIYTDTAKVEMLIKCNGILVKKLGGKPIENSGTVEYHLIHGELPEYSLEELLDIYCDNQYMVLMVACTDFYEGVTDSIQQKLNDLGIKRTPRDAGEASSFYAVINQGKLIKSEASNEKALYFERKIDGYEIDLCSGGQYVGNWADISIDGKSYCEIRKGLNVVVYDVKKDYLVDSIIYQDYKDVMIYRNIRFLSEPTKIECSNSLFDIINANIKLINLIKVFVPGLIIVVCIWMWNTIRVVITSKKQKRNINLVWFIMHQMVLLFMLIFAGVIVWGYKYLVEQFEDVSIPQLIFNMTTELGGTNWSDFRSLFIEIGLSIVLAVALVVVLSILVRRKKWFYKFLVSSTIIVCICIGMVGTVVAKFNKQYGLYDYAIHSQIKTTLYDDYYVNPENSKITFPNEKKNLIYIFLESMEISDSDIEAGGGKDINFIPELTNLSLENECFNGNSGKLNGAYVLGNTSWTVAGLVAQTAGVPLNAEINAYGEHEDAFLPGAYSIGQILEKNGYNNCFLIGSDKAFANRGKYFEEHGNYDVCDYNWAIENRKIPKDYFEWWGYEDVKLFDIAKDKISKMAAKNQPFNMTLLTTDTHFTDGYVCELCEEQHGQQYSNVLSCNSRQVVEFIDWIKQQDFYENTVIVLSGDHLCMDSSYFQDMPDNYDRRTYVNIINSDKEYYGESRIYTTMDLFPTTLLAMGCNIEGDRLGLGTDLYSKTETLAEILRTDSLDYQLGLMSKYYNNNILN